MEMLSSSKWSCRSPVMFFCVCLRDLNRKKEKQNWLSGVKPSRCTLSAFPAYEKPQLYYRCYLLCIYTNTKTQEEVQHQLDSLRRIVWSALKPEARSSLKELETTRSQATEEKQPRMGLKFFSVSVSVF